MATDKTGNSVSCDPFSYAGFAGVAGYNEYHDPPRGSNDIVSPQSPVDRQAMPAQL